MCRQLFARVITATNIQLARIMNWALLLFLLLLTDVMREWPVPHFVVASGIESTASTPLSVAIFGPPQRHVDLLYGTFSPPQALVDIATSFLFFLFTLPKSVEMAFNQFVERSTPWLEVDELQSGKRLVAVEMDDRCGRFAVITARDRIDCLRNDLLGWDPDQEAFGPVTGDAEKVEV